MIMSTPRAPQHPDGLADATAPDFVEQLAPPAGREDEPLDLVLGDCTTPEYQAYLAELEVEHAKRLAAKAAK
jgi:hypothetical protein